MITRIAGVVSVLLILGSTSTGQTDEQIDSWAERARLYVTRGQWSRVRSPSTKVLKADPDDEKIAKGLLLALRATGGKKARGDLIRDWSARTGVDGNFWFLERIEFLMETGADDRALSLLRSHVKRKPGYFFESLIGEIHRSRGRDKEATAQFEALVDKAKGEVVRESLDLVGLARAYLSYSHGGDAAESALVEAKGRDETNVRVRELLAEVYAERKERPADMRREYRDLLKLRPAWPDYELGVARAAKLRLGLAAEERKKAIGRALSVNPEHPGALFMHGVDLLSGGTETGARKAFERGLAFNPNHLQCLSGMAATAYLRGGEESWVSARDAVLARDVTYGRLYAITADILNSRRRWSEALDFMREGVVTDRSDATLWDDLARYALYLGLEEEGLKALKKADSLVRFGRVWRNNMHEVLRILAKNYAVIETEHFLIRVHKKNQVALGADFSSFLENSFTEFQERYGCKPNQKILWEVFADHKSFSVRTMGLTGLGLLGVCFGPTVAMDGPSARPAGRYNWASTAHHELAHVFTLQLSRNRVPRWLTEGLSTHEETRRNAAWGRGMEIPLHDALLTKTLFKVRRFDAAFGGPRIGFAYYQAGLMADLLMRRFGPKKVSHMLRLFGEDRNVDDVFQGALGISPEKFDQLFIADVKSYLKELKRVPSLNADSVEAVAKRVADGEATDRERIRLAWTYLRQGRSFDSGRIIEPLIENGSEDVELLLLKAARAARAKRDDVAFANWTAAQKAGSVDFDMLLGLASHFEKAGDAAAALKFYLGAAKSNPFARGEGKAPLLAAARLLEGDGKTAESIALLEQFADLSDKALGVRKRLLEYYRGQKDFSQVDRVLREMVWITPLDLDLRSQRAGSFVELGQMKAAVSEYEIALSLADEESEGVLRKELGRLFLTLDRVDDAVYHLERAVTLDGKDTESKRLLKQAEEKLKFPCP